MLFNPNQICNIMKKQLLNLMIAMLLISSVAFGQTRFVTGKVTDMNNQALPGTSIHIKGTSRGAVTDISGGYKLQISRGDSILVFAFVGYLTQEIPIGNKSHIDIQMQEDITILEELVVVGYGPQRSIRNRIAGAISSERRPQQLYTIVSDYDFNTESYTHHSETGFKDALLHPLSTFSIDVDNASYSNVRRFINSGQMPPPDAVRIEELLNYFKYDYATPADNHPFAIHTELSVCPWNPGSQLLHVGLQARNMEKESLPNSNLVFLIDVSGSMSPANRLPLVKTAMTMLVEELRPQDRVSIVVYAGYTQLVLESTPARDKQKILSAIAALQAGGGTAGGQALRMAYEVAEKNFIAGGNNRIIMATDGDFNVGESSNAAMERLVEEKRKNGVFITVLGFGMGNYKDDRLEIIANKGNGNYAYIDNIQEARKVLVSEFAGTLFTLAKDVKLQIEFNPARVKAYRLIGYENRRLNDEDFNNDEKDAGEMGAGHSVTALYEIIPAGSDAVIPGIDPLKYQANPVHVSPDPRAELLTVKARYKAPDKDESILFDKAVKGQLIPLARTSDNFRFAASVAEWGLLMRNSPYKGQASFENIINTALNAKGIDNEGYRAEFINLVRTAQNLEKLGMNR
jgi:Ca-activated chloride channel homolog